ncbi:MAG: pitrilysin family protein [Candidatus Metalachnospira sp.]|nr:pitrilysin family protein [Candidatus Metalachnospira sp.]
MIEIFTLDNGLRLVLEDIPYVRSIAFGIWIKTGTRCERPEENGVSHFIEHLMFKGTAKRSAKDIAEEMDALGGQINAYTTKEYTCYYTRTLDKHFDKALDVLSDMLLNSKLDNDDIKRERKVIEEEIDMYLDAPEELVHDAIEEAVWHETSLGMPICGTKKSIAVFDSNLIKDYYKRAYRPQNAVIAVTGNFDKEDILEKLTSVFGSWSNEGYLKTDFAKATYAPAVLSITKDIEQIHLCISFKAPERDSKYKYSLAVLNTLFGGGMSSRLFQKIREDEGLAYSIYSYTSAYSDTGIMTVYAATNRQKYEAVIESVMKEIDKLKTERINDKVIAVTKEQIISNYIISLENTASRLSGIGGSILLSGKVLPMEEILSQMERVNYDSIKEAVDYIFKAENMSLSAVGNVEGIDFERLVEDGKELLYSKNR